MKLAEMLEKRSKLVQDMRTLADHPKGEGGDLNAEQTAEFDRMKTEMTGLESRIERQRLLDDAERRVQGQQLTGSDSYETEVRNFSLCKLIASQLPGLNVDAGREREISQEVQRRAGRAFEGLAVPFEVFERRVLTSELDSNLLGGGNLISTDHLGQQYIDRLRSKLVINKLGATVLNGLHGNVSIPKLTGSVSAEWIAENSALTGSDADLESLTLTPKHVGALAEYSRNLILQSSPDIEQLLRADFAAILAEAIDSAAIEGGGANEPSGILDHSGLDTTTSLSTPTWAGVLELIEAVQLADSEGNAFLTTPSGIKTLRSTVRVASTDSQFIMEGPGSLAGYPCISSNLVPGDSTGHNIIFGNWRDLIVGYWSGLDLLVNPYETTAYKKGNVQLRGIITCDVGVRHIESFAASVDL